MCLRYTEGYVTHEIPLTKASIEAVVRDVDAVVKVEQRFLNPLRRDDVEFQYSVPVPDLATVISFVLVRQDGSKIVGIVQRKADARVTYDQAVKEGKLAGLAEATTPDVFTVSLGRLPPNETVTARLEYCVELTDDEALDSVRLHIPLAYGQRYGSRPSELPTSQMSDAFALAIQVSFDMSAAISSIGSSSHTVQTKFSNTITQTQPGACATLTYTSDEPLKRDFVANAQCTGLDKPRALAERGKAGDGTVAYALTMVPRFDLPDVNRQEFIFLVDRSGSMSLDLAGESSGLFRRNSDSRTRMQLAKLALVVMLRTLPHQDCVFNLWSFGSQNSSLWPASRSYNQSTLDAATQHVDSMEANFGGTELGTALKNVFSSRAKDRPTSVIVLTDGDTWNLDTTLQLVKEEADKSASGANYVRVFTLGIGSNISTATVDGVARSGRGVSSYVSNGETFTKKTARLLKAARVPPIEHVEISWPHDDAKAEDDFEMVEVDKKQESRQPETSKQVALSMFEETVDPLQSLDKPPPYAVPVKPPPYEPVQQSPRHIFSLAPANRLHVYAIVKSQTIPHSLKMTAAVKTGQRLEVEIPVRVSNEQIASSSTLPIHAIAAKHLIQSYQTMEHPFANADKDLEERTVKAAVADLGVKYQIASSETSFVAVDEKDVGRLKNALAYAKVGQAAFAAAPMAARLGAVPPPPSGAFPRLYGGGPPLAAPLAMLSSAPAAPNAAPQPFGAARAMVPQASMARSAVAPTSSSTPFAFGTARFSQNERVGSPQAAETASDKLDRLARLQSFDGSFSARVIELVNHGQAWNLVQSKMGSTSGSVQQSTLAIVYMKAVLKDMEEECQGLEEKARAFVLQEGKLSEESLDEIIQQAVRLF